MKTRFVNRLKSLFKSLKALALYAVFDDEERAIVEFEGCLELYPEDGHTLGILGKILINRGRHLEGIKRLNEALNYMIVRGKSDPELFAYIAYGYAELNRLDKAIDYYKKAINSWSKDGGFFTKVDVVYNLGRVYLQQGNYIEAKNIYELGIHLNNKEAKLHFGLGTAYYELGQYEYAFHHLEAAIELEPTFEDDKTMKKLRNELRFKMTIH